MMLFSALIQPKLFLSNKTWLPLKTSSQVAAIGIILLSVFLMTPSVESNENVEQYNGEVYPLNFVVTKDTLGNIATFMSVNIQDECLDCHSKSCQCCSYHLFIFGALKVDVFTSEFSFHGFQIIRVDAFYDLLLRPPIA